MLSSILFAGIPVAAPIPKDVPEEPLLFSIKKGTKYVYSEESRGKILANDMTHVITDVKPNGDGYELTISEAIGKGQHLIEMERLLVSKQGVCRISDSTFPLSSPYWLLKLPAKEGDEWPNDRILSKSMNVMLVHKGVTKVMAKELVEVPAGKYMSIKVEYRNIPDTNEVESRRSLWFAPGIGIVKMQWSRGGPYVLKSVQP